MESLLTTIADYLWTQSWQIALLVGAVGLASWALRNRSAHVRYLLWLLVLAKCLTPPIVEVPLAVLPDREPSAVVPIISTAPPQEEVARTAVEKRLPPTPTPAAREPLRLTTRQWLAVGWLAGVAVFTCVALTKAARTILWLRRERRTLPRTSGDSFDETFRSLGVKRPPRIWLIEGVGQPFVWGILRGDIYLPNRFAGIDDDEHRRDILAHEISHVLRFDAAVNLLQIIAQAIFWFHPLLWWANQRIRREREKCCDEMAIAHLGARPKDYSSAIVSTLIETQESTRPVPSLAVAGPVKNIEERVRTMLKPGRQFYKRPSLIDATVILLLGLLTVPTALVLTARAQTEATKLQSQATPSLHEAAQAGNIEQVKWLISKGASINAKNGKGETPLDIAVVSVRASREMVELLRSKGAKGSTVDSAAHIGDIAKVEYFIKNGLDVNSKTSYSWTPLHAAAAGGSKEAIEFLITRGADVKVTDSPWGCTPLHKAAWNGNKDAAEVLIAKGSYADSKTTGGSKTPLMFFATPSQLTSFQTPLHWAAIRGHDEVAKLLISKGANVNAKDYRGWTPLHLAAAYAHAGTVELLLANGADSNAETNANETPLDVSAQNQANAPSKKAIVDLLLANGAEVRTLHAAAHVGNLGKVQNLIENGADVNGKNSRLCTPLHVAAASGHKEVAELLIAKGADANASSRIGFRPLHSAAQGGYKDIVELLIAKGAHVNDRENNDQTPLHLACLRTETDVVELLIAKGADIDAKNSKGQTALSLAKELGHEEVVRLLRQHGANE
jgi:cytohesin